MDRDGEAAHAPVMLEEVVEALAVDRDGLYVDATFGRGGHARRLLAELSPRARLLAIDRDADAYDSARRLAETDARVRARRGRFGSLGEYLAGDDHGGPGAQSGVMFDVGMSSPQLDEPGRGFGFSVPGPLDMRMDRRDALTAGVWLNDAKTEDLATVIRRYGEERHARRVARAIVAARPLETTTDLAEVVARAVPGRGSATPARARVFQAVRIHINDELGELDRGLDAGFDALRAGGRLAVLTFHGLEHRLVRRRFRQWVEGPRLPRRLPVRHDPEPLARRLDTVGKGRRPSAAEVGRNPRARSALLQVVEKLGSAADSPPVAPQTSRAVA
ncbi:MAG: 16S rRNA (cytosine(1402)-N(4))-methyltransferase RsmH [Gammaproteobacteria bacterium]|nr:16S rRNA (cytosine(1402)-N(4))-methyltransferase RsmH [Gammaproteobacteria bacterium]